MRERREKGKTERKRKRIGYLVSFVTQRRRNVLLHRGKGGQFLKDEKEEKKGKIKEEKKKRNKKRKRRIRRERLGGKK